MNIVLNFEPSLNPKKDDLIVYDAYNKRFVQVSKLSFLNETNKKIIELENKNKELEKKIEKMQGNIIELARILKGEL